MIKKDLRFRHMKRKKAIIITVITLLLSLFLLSSCGDTDEKTKVKVLIIPKFEVGEMTGDFPGEAQFFYEKYCAGCEEAEIPNMPPTAHFYVNEENGVAILLPDQGKQQHASH